MPPSAALQVFQSCLASESGSRSLQSPAQPWLDLRKLNDIIRRPVKPLNPISTQCGPADTGGHPGVHGSRGAAEAANNGRLRCVRMGGDGQRDRHRRFPIRRLYKGESTMPDRPQLWLRKVGGLSCAPALRLICLCPPGVISLTALQALRQLQFSA